MPALTPAAAAAPPRPSQQETSAAQRAGCGGEGLPFDFATAVPFRVLPSLKTNVPLPKIGQIVYYRPGAIKRGSFKRVTLIHSLIA